MQNRSNAHKRLLWLYRQVLIRMRIINCGGQLRILIEPLQSRLFMSVTPAGVETLVNTTINGGTPEPQIAMNPAGNSVVVWTTGDSGGEVLAQRFDINGNRVGGQFQVDQAQAGGNAGPDVAMDDAGDFVVVWTNGPS